MGVQYQTLERIAVGGMGEVFLARQESIGGFRRTVVLKRLLPDIEGDDDMVRRFLDEARVAACLSHENVVTVLEVGDEEGSPYLALEYVHGVNAGSLRQRARRKQIRFPIVVVARLVADAARGLAHAHEAKDVEGRPLHIVHRDVSPKNIFVRADGLSKIGDFGIAKSEHRLSKTATGAVPGTLSYMAPEQSAGQECTAAADQFSLGIVLWELLAGEPLFKAPSPQETLRNLLQKPISRPSKKREDAEPLDAIVKRMLERDPAKRFASLADVATAIETAMPEARAELGQRAVAMFVEAVAGDDLRERMRRIECGPDETMRVEREHPQIGLERPKSDSGNGNPGDESWKTPVTLTRGSGAENVSDSSNDPTRKDRLSAATPGSLPLSLSPAPRARFASTVLPKAAAAFLLVALVVAAVVAGYARFHAPTPQERSAQYLDDAIAVHPELHRAVFLAMADIQYSDDKDAAAKLKKLEPVADALVALGKERLTSLRAGKGDAGFADRARKILAGIGDDELAEQELDMWDYDMSAPVRWLDPDPVDAIQAMLVQGGLEFMHAQTELRHRSVDRLIARSGSDPKAVHAALDPLVSAREKLIERSAAAPAAELLGLDREIARLAHDGEAKLVALMGPVFGKATAGVAFHTVSDPDAWQPLFETPPSEAAVKASGKASPETH